MPAPVRIAHTHVHSMRIASGSEALVARVWTIDGVAGLGFTLNFEAVVAREMAAWDALARIRKTPFYALFGSKARARVEIVDAHATILDPFEGLPLEEVRRRATAYESVALRAPNTHAWEISYCTAIAASLPGDVRIAAPGASPAHASVSDAPGLAIDWSAEPAFERLRWLSA